MLQPSWPRWRGSKEESKKSRRRGGLPSLDTPAVDPTLPERLDRGQVLRAIRRHFSKVKDCRRLEPDIQRSGDGTFHCEW